MYTIDSSCRRRGISTILGVIIFVGIMFTAVIPMFLVMNQADILHEIRKVEVGRLDEEHAMEDIYFYLKPTVVNNEPILTLKISNRGELAVRIKRVWVNETLREDFDCIIPPISDMDLELGNLIVPDPLESVIYHVMAVTDKGNIFSPTSGIPSYNPLTEAWTMDDFTIYIMMAQPTNSLHIQVEKETDPDVFDTIISEDVLSFRSIYEMSVQVEGTFRVTVYRFYGQTPEERLLDGEVVVLSLLKSSDVVWVP